MSEVARMSEAISGTRLTQSRWAQPLIRSTHVFPDAKATTSVVSDVLLPHELRLVQRGHRQRGRRQVHLLRRW